MKKNKKNIMGIYAIRVDAPNGPYFYVGKSIDIDKRMKQHIYNSQTNPKAHVDAAISQYEWYWEVMKRCNRKELNKWEKSFIRKYNTYKQGYNNTIGGDSSYRSSVREVGEKDFWPPH